MSSLHAQRLAYSMTLRLSGNSSVKVRTHIFLSFIISLYHQLKLSPLEKTNL